MYNVIVYHKICPREKCSCGFNNMIGKDITDMITFEAKIREQTVRLYASVPLKNGAGAIFRVLADVSRKTNIFNNRFTLNFGWGFFFLTERTEENGEKFWVVQTIDFNGNPARDRTDDLTTALVVQNMQMEAVQVAKVKPVNCTCKDTVLVLKAAIESNDVYMHRKEETKEGDSGWYFGLMDDPDEENHVLSDFEAMPSYKLIAICPEAMRVLQLPVGTVAVFSNKQLTALVDADDNAMKFTSEEERRRLGEKQRKEFEAEVAAAQERAKAEQAAKAAAESESAE